MPVVCSASQAWRVHPPQPLLTTLKSSSDVTYAERGIPHRVPLGNPYRRGTVVDHDSRRLEEVGQQVGHARPPGDHDDDGARGGGDDAVPRVDGRAASADTASCPIRGTLIYIKNIPVALVGAYRGTEQHLRHNIPLERCSRVGGACVLGCPDEA